jgi:hypothetical protein
VGVGVSEGAVDELAFARCESRSSQDADGHNYLRLEEHRNCTVTVLECKDCGHSHVLWHRNDVPPVEADPSISMQYWSGKVKCRVCKSEHFAVVEIALSRDEVPDSDCPTCNNKTCEPKDGG